MARYIIRVRDSSRALLGEVDAYSHFECVLRFNNTSNWLLELDADHPMAGYLATKGNGIMVIREIVNPYSGVLFSTKVLLSGPIRGFNRKKQGNLLAVRGLDDTMWMAARDAWPVPSATTPANFSSSAYDTRTGVAETIIRQYVDVNAGPSAPAARQVSGLTLDTDVGRGSTVKGNARFDPLMTKDGTGLAQVLAQNGGVGFRIVQSGTNLQLQFYVPSDLSASVIFSEALGNLVDFEYDDGAPDLDSGGNFVVVGGGGDGTSRVFRFVEDSGSESDWGRIETFRDARDTSDTTTLDQRGADTLDNSKEQITFSAILAQTEQMVYGVNFDLGDQVTAIVDNTAIVDIIREVNIKLDKDTGETVAPTIGTPNPQDVKNALAALARKNQQVQTRISRLERTK